MPTTAIAPYIDATGVHVPDYAAIRAWLVTQYQTIFGADVYLGNDSQDGQFLGILALALTDWTADITSAYNAFSPATAQGVNLSSVVKLNGLTRNVPTQSTVDVDIVGQAGTSIDGGIVQDANGNKWNLPAHVAIPNTGTITVTATAQASGAITAQANTVTGILTPVRGWQSVTNPAAAAPGAPVESDAALRRRQAQSTQLPANSALGALVSGLANLVGVTEVVIHENYTDAPDGDGVPAHSIATIVAGGNVADIAAMIARKKTPGCNTYGTTSELTADPNGLPITVEFSRPVDVPVAVVINVHPTASSFSTATVAAIEAEVAAYIDGLAIGEGLVFNRLWPYALLAGQGSFGSYTVAAMTANGGTVDIAVAYNQELVCSGVAVNIV